MGYIGNSINYHFNLNTSKFGTQNNMSPNVKALAGGTNTAQQELGKLPCTFLLCTTNQTSDLFLLQTGTHPQNSVNLLMAMEVGKRPPDIRCNSNLYLVNEAKL